MCHQVEPSPYHVSKFMALPNEEERHQCYREFYETTSNCAMVLAICAICVQERDVETDHVKEMLMKDIPNLGGLHPSANIIHSAQDLVDGMLLEMSGIIQSQDLSVATIRICRQCKTALEKLDLLTPPEYSLANNLWMGNVP